MIELFTDDSVVSSSPGGAERLIVDAGCGLKDLGHLVEVYTSHWDPERCFKETKDGMVCFP